MKKMKIVHKNEVEYLTDVKSVQMIDNDEDTELVVYNREKGKTVCHSYQITDVQFFEAYEVATLELQELVPLVEQWFVKRGIDKGNGNGQVEKLMEEVEELEEAHYYGDAYECRDAVGDIMVVLIGYCMQQGYDIAQCLEGAYEEIKNRTGKVNSDGVFVKDE